MRESIRKKIDGLEVSSIEDIFFPVDFHPLFWVDQYQNDRRTHSYSAVVDEEYNSLIAVVSKQYYLIRNEDAYKFARRLLDIIFCDEVPFDVVRASFLSRNCYSCQIDLARIVDKSQPLVNDGWVAYMTLTNSYNKTSPLKFSFGMKNIYSSASIVLPELSIDFSMAHTDKNVCNIIMGFDFLWLVRAYINGTYDVIVDKKYGRYVNWFEKVKDIRDIEMRFAEIIRALKTVELSENLTLPFICKALRISPTDHLSSSIKSFLISCRENILNLYSSYSRLNGNNAYSILLAAGEFAENNKAELSWNSKYGHISLSEYLGSWAVDLAKEVKKPGFDIPSYIKNGSFVSADWLMQLEMD